MSLSNIYFAKDVANKIFAQKWYSVIVQPLYISQCLFSVWFLSFAFMNVAILVNCCFAVIDILIGSPLWNRIKEGLKCNQRQDYF